MTESMGTTQQGSRNNTVLIVAIVVVVLLLCCCCGLILAGWFYGDAIMEALDNFAAAWLRQLT